MNATHPADPKAVDEDVTANVYATLSGHARRTMATALCSPSESRRFELHTELSRRWAQLADFVIGGGLARLDAEDVLATPADDAEALRAAVARLNTPVTTPGAAS